MKPFASNGAKRIAAALILLPAPGLAQDASRLGLPVRCELGRDCFVQ